MGRPGGGTPFGGGAGSRGVAHQRPLRLVELQDVLNSDHEEKLVQGLQRAALQMLREHGYRRRRTPAAGLEGQAALAEDEDDEEVSDGELEWPADDGSEAEEAAARPEEEGEGKEDYDDEDYDNGEAEDEEHEEEDEDGAASSDEGEEEGREKEEDVEVEAGVDQPPRTQAAAAVNVAAPRGEVKGLLAEYLASSPQVAELFQLWDLEQRQASRKVAEKHTLLLATVLRCMHGTAQQARAGALSRRLLHERATELQAQLISSNQGLATATLRLLKALVRLGPGAAWEVVSRFSLTAKPVLHLFASSSSRPVAVALVAALVRCPDPAMAVRILSTDRVLKAVFRSLLSDRARTVEAWMAALAWALRHPRVPAKIKRRLVTASRLEQLRRLLLPSSAAVESASTNGGDGGTVAQGGAVRRELVCRLIRDMLGGRAKGGDAGRVKGARGVLAVVRLLLALSGSEDSVQHELALSILEGHPDVAAPFMWRFNQTWEARPSFTGLSSYVFLARLLRAQPPAASALFACDDEVQGQQEREQQEQQQRGRAFASGSGSVPASGTGAADGMERALGGLLPSGLGKRELTKAILGQSPLLQRMGLLLLAHVLRRAQAAIAQAAPAAAKALRLALPHRLPDLQAVLAVRSRCGAQGTAPPPTWGPQMLALVLRVLGAYQAVVPEAMDAFRFDFLRLVCEQPVLAALPGFVQWELLRLLEALGPDRLQWLPPDTQAWASSSAVAGGARTGAGDATAFQQVLGLLGQTRDRRLYALARRLLLGVIQSKAGVADVGLGEALLDAWDGSGGAAELLECALRLGANRPYPFSLMVLKLLPAATATRPPSPVLVALLLLTTSRAFTGEEEEALRVELQVFGLSLDALKGRFASSPAALRYVRSILRAQRAAATAGIGCSSCSSSSAGKGMLEALDVSIRLLLLDRAGEEGADEPSPGGGRRRSKVKRKAEDGAKRTIPAGAAGLRAGLARFRGATEEGPMESALWDLEQAMTQTPLGRLLGEAEKKVDVAELLQELVAGLGASGQGSAGARVLAGYMGEHAVDSSVFDVLASGSQETLSLLAYALPLHVLLAHHAAATMERGRMAGERALGQQLQHRTSRTSIAVVCSAVAVAAQQGASAAHYSSLLRVLAHHGIRCALTSADGGNEHLVVELKQRLCSSVSAPSSGWTPHAWLGAAALLRVLLPAGGLSGMLAAASAPGEEEQQDGWVRRALGWALLYQDAPSPSLLRCLYSGTVQAEAALIHACLQEVLLATPAVVEGMDVEARLRVASSLFVVEGNDGSGMDLPGMGDLLLQLAAPGGHAPSIVPALAERVGLVGECWDGLCATARGDDGNADANADAAAWALLLGRCVQEVEAARGFVFGELAKRGSRRLPPLLLAPAMAVLASRAPADEGQRALLLQCADALGCAVLSAAPFFITRSPLEAWTVTALTRVLRQLAETDEDRQQLLPLVERWLRLLSAAITEAVRGEDGVSLHVPFVTALAGWMVSPPSPLAIADKGRIVVVLAAGACCFMERWARRVQMEGEADGGCGNSGDKEVAAEAEAGAWMTCLCALSSDADAGPLLRDALARELAQSVSVKKGRGRRGEVGIGNEEGGQLLAGLRGLVLAITARQLQWTAGVISATDLLACVLPSGAAEPGRTGQGVHPLVAAALEGLHQGDDSQARLLLALQEKGREAVLRLLLLLTAHAGGWQHGKEKGEEEERGDRSPSPILEHGRHLVPVLLATYTGSLSRGDLLTLRLLWILAAGGLRLGLSWFRVGVSVEEADRAMEDGRFSDRMEDRGSGSACSGEAAAWLLEWVDSERVFTSLECFPLHRPLFPPPVEPWEEEEGKEEEDGEHGAAALHEASVYDPAFMLPLLDGLLQHQSVPIRALVDSCLLPYCLVALASACRGVRACAQSCLRSILQLLDRAPKNDPAAKERPQLLLLLDVVRSSLVEPCARLPCIHALFLARSAIVLSRPANDLYVALNGFLVRRQSLDLGDVPLFLPLFFSSRAFHKRERVWTLRLLRDGLRTEEDLSLLHRRQGLALLFAFLDAALCRPTGGGVPADSLVISIGLEVLTAAAAVRQGPVLLLKQGGMLAWVCGAVGSVLQQLKPPEQGGQRRWQRPGGTGGALPKGAMRALQSILTLTSRTIQGFAGQQQQQDARWLEDSDRSLLPLPGVTDQAQALVPLLLLLLQQGLLPPTAHVRHGSSAPPRHTPAAILALARAMLDLLGSLQGRLLPALGLTLKQAVSLVEAVGAMAAPAPVKEDAARRVLGLIVRDAGATEGGGMLQEAGRESAGPDAAASLVEWLLEGTSSLLHAPSCGEHEHEQVLALSMSAGAGRLALRLLQQLQPTAGTAVGARIVASPRRPWPWSLVSLLSCPAFLPGSLHSSDATAPARNAAKAAWLAVAAHLIAVAGQQEQEQGEGGGEEERAFVRELEAILKTTDGGAGVMVDVVGCAVQALIGRERPGTGREGQLQRLREETCTALALLGIPFAAVRTGGWGGKEKQKRPVVAATGNDGPSTSACSKRKRSRKA